jgi:hypothetical protein
MKKTSGYTSRKKSARPKAKQKAVPQDKRAWIEASSHTIEPKDKGKAWSWPTKPKKEEMVVTTCPDCGYTGGRHSRLCQMP